VKQSGRGFNYLQYRAWNGKITVNNNVGTREKETTNLEIMWSEIIYLRGELGNSKVKEANRKP